MRSSQQQRQVPRLPVKKSGRRPFPKRFNEAARVRSALKFSYAEFYERNVEERLLKSGGGQAAEIQTDADEGEATRLEEKLREREEYVRKNTTKVLKWLFEHTDIKTTDFKIGDSHHPHHPPEAETPLRAPTAGGIREGYWPGVQSLLRPTEYCLRRRPDWRLVINSNQFTIVGNEDRGDSFYRALAQAITSSEDNADSIRKSLYQHVANSKNWTSYEPQLRLMYKNQSSCPISITSAPSKDLAKLYKTETLKEKKPGSYFQLRVAAQLFNFNFILVFKKHYTVKWVNFKRRARTSAVSTTNSGGEGDEPPRTFLFFVWPTPETPLWKLLLPVDSVQSIPDGDYPLFIKRTFTSQHFSSSKGTLENTPPPPPNEFPDADDLVHNLVTLQGGLEEFEFPLKNTELPQDLYSLLSTIFFGNSFHEEEIRNEILEHRERFEYFINLNPKRKHYSSGKKPFLSHFRQEWGDSMDLKMAASIYKFCYTVVAMDRHGNLSHTMECRDRGHSHFDPQVNYIVLFTRVTPRSLLWFKLELVDLSNVPELSPPRVIPQTPGPREEEKDQQHGYERALAQPKSTKMFIPSLHHGPSTLVNDNLEVASVVPGLSRNLGDLSDFPELTETVVNISKAVD